jgi:hypothetical protein
LKEGSSVTFAQNTDLLIDKKLDTDKNVSIHNGGNMVWIFVEEDAKVDDGNSITANIYCEKHLHIDKTPSGNPTYMTGLFIAEKIDSKDNVFWNWQSEVCPFSAPLLLVNPQGNPNLFSSEAPEAHGLNIFPNPASDKVNIHLHGIKSYAVLTIYDQLGRMVLTEQMEEGQIATTIHLGSYGLKAGVYFLTAEFDGEKITRRLVITK